MTKKLKRKKLTVAHPILSFRMKIRNDEFVELRCVLSNEHMRLPILDQTLWIRNSRFMVSRDKSASL